MSVVFVFTQQIHERCRASPPFVQQVVVGHRFELLLTALYVQAQSQSL